MDSYLYPEKFFNHIQQKKRVNQCVYNHARQNIYLGYAAQKYLIKELEKANIKKSVNEPLLNDMRTFQILNEHRSIMKWRLKYLYNIECIQKDYSEEYSETVENPSLFLKNIMIKNSIHYKEENVLRVINIWRDTMTTEENILNKVIDNINY